MYKFHRYREQYIQNLRLAFPVIISQLGAVIVQLADNIMVGRYGGDDPIPLAAAAFAGSIIFVPMVMAMGMTFGLTPIVGELFAQGNKRKMSNYLQNGLILYSVMAILVTILQFLLIPIMWHLGQPEEVVAMAIPYYDTLVWSIFPLIIFFTFKQFLEGIGNTHLAMVCIIVSNIINVILNYMLIGGEWGAPEMGVTGAGVATLISRFLTAIFILVAMFSTPKLRSYLDGFSLQSITQKSRIKLLKIGWPISAQVSLEVMSFVIISLMFGWFNASAISSFQIANSIGSTSFMIAIAIGSATTIRVSHCFGRGDISMMRRASSAAWHLSVVWAILVIITILMFRHQMVRIFTSNEQTIELASTLLIMIAIYQIPDMLQCIGVSIMRGMQDMKIIPLIAFVAYWACNLPVGYLCAFHLGMGPAGLYVGLIVGLSVATVLAYLRIKRVQRLKLY